jgi:hypothetical protein
MTDCTRKLIFPVNDLSTPYFPIRIDVYEKYMDIFLLFNTRCLILDYHPDTIIHYTLLYKPITAKNKL